MTSEIRGDRPSRFAPLRDRRFAIFFATFSTSMFGTSMAAVALSFGILESTGSLVDLGYVLAARIVPMVLFLLFGGVAGDRLSRRWVMIGADGVRVFSQGGIAVLFAVGHTPLTALILLAAAGGLSEAFFNPAMDGIIPSLVDRRQLQEANALLGLARSAANVAGPAVAGVLIAATSPATALAVDAASYAASMVGLFLLRLPNEPARQSTSLIKQLGEGWAMFRQHTWLWTITVQFALFNLLVWAPYLVLGPAVAFAGYGGASAWGAIMAGYGGGSIVGGLLLLGRRPRRPLVVAIGAAVALATPSACLLLTAPIVVVVVGAVFAGIASAVFNGLFSTTIQQQVPDEALSRINSYVVFGAYAFGPLGLAIAGPVAQFTSVTAVLAVGVAWQVVSSAVVLAMPSVRALRQSAPSEKPVPETAAQDSP